MALNTLSFMILILLGRVSKESRTIVLTYNDSMAIRGIATLLVAFAHSYDFLINRGYSVGIGKLWLLTGGIGVCLFFFLSGYGLNISNGVEKKNYILRRLKGVLIPFIVLEFIFFIVETPLISINIFNFFQYLIRNWNSSWFVLEILLIYIGYYICYLIFGRKRLNNSMLIFNIGIGFLFIILQLDPKWYNGHLLFSVGMYIADYNSQIIKYMTNKNWWFNNIIGTSFYCIFAILFVLNKEILWANLFKIISGICICFVIINTMLHYKFKSKQLVWIGKNSLLIYIIHGHILQIMQARNSLNNACILFIIGLLITFCIVIIYNGVIIILSKLTESTSKLLYKKKI